MTKGYYKADDVSMMLTKLVELSEQRRKLDRLLLLHDFNSQKGKEHCHHGLLRRIKVLSRNVENVFNLLLPDMEGRPSSEVTIDATTNLHAFYINLFGACDNLAWILVFEQNIRTTAGTDIPRNHVGVRRKNRSVRAGMSNELKAEFAKFEDWFDHVEEFRDSLAHRIPLYIPPFVVKSDRAEDYHRLDDEAWAALQNYDVEGSKEKREEQKALTIFRPWFTHSFSEGSPHMAIHPQLLADFGTILELSEAVAKEIE